MAFLFDFGGGGLIAMFSEFWFEKLRNKDLPDLCNLIKELFK